MARKTNPHANYILDLLEDLRAANNKAEEASTKWNVISEKVNARLDRLDIKSKWERSKDRSQDIDLNDAFSSYAFWRDESIRLSSTITAEYHAREMVKVAIANHPDVSTVQST